MAMLIFNFLTFVNNLPKRLRPSAAMVVGQCHDAKFDA